MRCQLDESVFLVSENARQGISDSIGGELVAKRLLPEQPGEIVDRERANLVLNLLGKQLGELMPDVEVG